MNANRSGLKEMKLFKKIKLVFLFFIIQLINACSKPDKGYLMYVGTYTGQGSDGIYAYHFNPDKGELIPIGLVAKTDNPTFIAIDSTEKFLYAVNELDSFQNQPTGAISVFAIDKKSGQLKLLQQISSLGAAPAHLSVDKSGRNLLVANYNGGNFVVFPIGIDGQLAPHTTLKQDSGSSVKPEQQGPHAHFIQATNNNKFVLTADLGIDKIIINRFNDKTGILTPAGSGFAKLEPGSGPRHIAFSPSGKYVYVLNELNSTVTVFSLDDETGVMQSKQVLSTLPENFKGNNSGAEIEVDSKGKFLYVSNRGDNSIGQFSINSDDGSLKPVDWISSGGKTPRNFAIDPTGKWLFAANQDSDNIAMFRIDAANGRLKQVSDSTRLVAPVCIRLMSLK